MKRAGLALVLVACSSSSKDFPPLPEGSGPGGNTGTGPGGTGRDAGIDGVVSDAGVPITGRVCLITDLRAPTSTCASDSADGFTVTLGTAHALDAGTTTVVGTATTAADGSFTMVAPLGPGLVWHVTDSRQQLTTSVMDFGTENTIPAMLSELYGELVETNTGRLPLEDHGAVALRVVRGLTPVAGIAATVAPAADSDTFYDSPTSITAWNASVTDIRGMVWIPDAQLGPANITLTATGGTTHLVTTTVERQAITFVTRTLP